jgi:hypothetical protein
MRRPPDASIREFEVLTSATLPIGRTSPRTKPWSYKLSKRQA